MSDGGDGLGNVVEYHHAVVETETKVRDTAIVGRRVWQSLDVPDCVVTREADGTAAESRQSGHVTGPVGAHHSLKQLKGIGVFAFVDAVRVGSILTGCRKLQIWRKRVRPDETVTAEPLTAHDAFEEERPIAVVDLAERVDGGQRVADELPVDRHQAGPAGEPGLNSSKLGK